MTLGGQPADIGVISSPDGSVKFNVAHVQKPKGTSFIQHLGTYQSEKQLSWVQQPLQYHIGLAKPIPQIAVVFKGVLTLLCT